MPLATDKCEVLLNTFYRIKELTLKFFLMGEEFRHREVQLYEFVQCKY